MYREEKTLLPIQVSGDGSVVMETLGCHGYTVLYASSRASLWPFFWRCLTRELFAALGRGPSVDSSLRRLYIAVRVRCRPGLL